MLPASELRTIPMDKDKLAVFRCLVDSYHPDEPAHGVSFGELGQLLDTIEDERRAVAALQSAFERSQRVAEETENRVTEALDRIDEIARERDASRKAKQENDERFMLERDEARAERDELKR